MAESVHVICRICREPVPRYFAIEGKAGRPICAGCALDRWIPADYQERERYAPACPHCGGALTVVEQARRKGERQQQCSRCGLRWEEIEIEHFNATRRPPLGIDWLDERHQTLGEALLMCRRKPRL